ncbi:hypothetical protein Tco_0409501 [Tanacetum coccineum]
MYVCFSCPVGVVLLVKDCRMINHYYSEDQYAVSIKEDTAYPCLHSPKTTGVSVPVLTKDHSGIKINTPYPEDSIRHKMAEENVPAPAPTRSDEQILPFNAWLPDAKTGAYSFQLDEQWFTLNADLLRKALEITHVDTAHLFVSPPVGDQVMEFVNDLGYLEEIHFVSKMHVNNLYQLWRAILSLINQCLTGKTSSNDKPRHLEEFVQAIQIFFPHRANLNIPTKKPTPHVIPYCRFTKLIIYYLGSEHNIHRRLGSLIHVTGDNFPLGNLKFVPKGEKDEVFGKPIPRELITEAIQNSPYYQQYLEMVARKSIAKKGKKKKTTSKADKPKKPTLAKQPTLAEQTKPVKEKTSKPTPSNKIHKGKVMKVRKVKRSDRLVDEEDKEPQPASKPQAPVGGVAIREPASGITQRLLIVEGKGKGIATDEQIPVTQDAPTRPSTQPHDDTSVNVVRDTSSLADAETRANMEKSNNEGDTKILNVDEERGENISNMVTFEERTVELDEGQAGSDPGKTPESQPPPEHVLMEEDQAGSNPGQSHMVLARPNPEPMHKDFVATVYPQVHKSLKHTTKEHVYIEKPLRSIPDTLINEEFLMMHLPLLLQAKDCPLIRKPINDVPIPDDVHISDSEDTVAAHLSKIKTRPDWLNHVPKEERSETPEPDWAVPPNDLSKTEKNWANAIANAYKDPEENKLIWKTGDMGSFIKWYCKQIRKSKLSKADLEGPAFKLVRPFHKNSISIQFQMEECHLLLTDQIDLVNPEGNRIVSDVSKPLPLGGPPGQVTIQPQYFFNKDLEYLVSGDKERMNALSISKLKASYYPNFGLKELVPSLWIECEQDDTIIHKSRAVIYRDMINQKMMMRESEVHKFSDGTSTRILEKLDHMVKDYAIHVQSWQGDLELS